MVWTKKKIRIKKIEKNLSVLLRYNFKLIVPSYYLIADSLAMFVGTFSHNEATSNIFKMDIRSRETMIYFSMSLMASYWNCWMMFSVVTPGPNTLYIQHWSVPAPGLLLPQLPAQDIHHEEDKINSTESHQNILLWSKQTAKSQDCAFHW